MTDWLAWMLEELEEEEDQGEDLDWNAYALPRWQEKEKSWEEENRRLGEAVQVGEEGETDRTDTSQPTARTADADMLKAETEGQISRTEEDREGASLSIPLAVKREQTMALAQADRRMGTEPEWSWQEGTPAGTGDVRTAEPGRRERWLPAGGMRLRTEADPADSLGRTASAQGEGYLYAAVQGGEYLYTAARRARAAVEQARVLQQAGPVVIREPAAVGGKWPTPAELDRIFQRDARRYDGGFTLF